jgi:hypothetical protein
MGHELTESWPYLGQVWIVLTHEIHGGHETLDACSCTQWKTQEQALAKKFLPRLRRD